MSGSTPVFANNAASTLASGVASTDTTAVLAPGTGVLFPSPTDGQYFSITFISAANLAVREIAYVTQMTGDTIAVMQRGREGTTALSWSAGDLAQNLITAGDLAAIFAGGGLSSVAWMAFVNSLPTAPVQGSTTVWNNSGSPQIS